METGFHAGKRLPVTDSELRLIDAIIKKTVAAIDGMQKAEKLKQEHYLLHALMENIPDAIYFKDTASRFIRSSRALARKIGLSDPAALVGKTDFDLFTDEHARQAFDDEQRIVATGRPKIDIIEKETWTDSRVTWVSTTKMPLLDDAGTVIGTFGISRDITSRKEMEDALKFRLEFEEHITSSSGRFISLDLKAIDGAVRDVLELIGTFLSADRSLFILLREETDSIEKCYEWHDSGAVSGNARYMTIDQFKWLWNALRDGNDIIIPSDNAPGNDIAANCREFMGKDSVGAIAYVPLVVSGLCGGIIGVESVDSQKSWAADTVALLKVIGEVIINAMSRKRSEEKLQQANNVLERRVQERTEDLRNANELLKTHIDQLSFLNRSVYRLSPLITTGALLPEILDVFMSRFTGAQGCIILLSEEGTGGSSATALLQGEHHRESLEKIASVMAGRSIMQPVFISDRAADEQLCGIPLDGVDTMCSMVAIPLLIDNVCRAVIAIFTNDYSAGTFYIEQSLLTTLAAHAAICLSNAFNARELAEKARIDGELEAARSIQRRFTPQQRPDIPGIDLKGVYYPANKVGGDYLDYFRTGRGDWVVVIADVCGKGIPAALFMTTMRSAFRILAETETSARELLCSVNSFMAQNIDERSFVTALCLVIAVDGSSMTYARAGHPLLIKIGGESGVPENVPCSGIALGLMDDAGLFAEMIQEKRIVLESGDRYLLYTDGLVEASDTEKNAYGSGRLNALLAAERDADPENLVTTIIDDIKAFSGGAPDYDDLTLLVFRVN